MKVLYVGFSKTGTITMAEAFKELGFVTYDFQEHFYEVGDSWMKIFRNRDLAVDLLREMYTDVDAVSDIPVFMYWREFLQAFPDIKFVFCDREDMSWLKSWNQQLRAQDSNEEKLLTLTTPCGIKLARYYRGECKCIFGVKLGWNFWNPWQNIKEDTLLKSYREHRADVLENIPQEKLLVMKLSDEWKPLCEFLETSVPSVRFPHANKNEQMVPALYVLRIPSTKE